MDKDICKRILAGMRIAGYEVCDDEYVDTWDTLEVEYFLANYHKHYIKEKSV
jgi:hypothetical protein